MFGNLFLLDAIFELALGRHRHEDRLDGEEAIGQFGRKLKGHTGIKQQLMLRMYSKVSEVGTWLRSVVRGWLGYHAVPGSINYLTRSKSRMR